LIALPLVKLAIQLLAAGCYSYFRDELYYLACSHRLGWGYVDHPPFSIAALRVWTTIFGESVVAIRALAALAGAATVLVTGLTVRALGGGSYAAALAMLSVLVAPEYFSLNGFYSMNALDVLIWALAGYVLVRILHRSEERLWPALGLVLGIGLLNKLSVLWLGAGLVAGLVLTRERRRLLTAGPWLAAAIAALVAAPHLLWQAGHGWPTAEFIHQATSVKMRSISPLDFTLAQVENQLPLTAPVWLAGLVFSLGASAGRRVRPIGVIYLTVFALLVFNEKSRTGYLAASYPMLLACGATWIAERLRGRPAWLRPASLALLTVAGAVSAPLALPFLPPEQYAAYARLLGKKPSTEENKLLSELPQFIADFFGWPELVAKVEAAYASLPPEGRAQATILTSNYGEAGALEVLGAGRGLPPVVSGHNNYWLWGPGPRAGDPLIVSRRRPWRAGLPPLHALRERESRLRVYRRPHDAGCALAAAQAL
jgi:4-amino-4-deoxy-L-arabinose transferase-like glycosyltransferase